LLNLDFRGEQELCLFSACRENKNNTKKRRKNGPAGRQTGRQADSSFRKVYSLRFFPAPRERDSIADRVESQSVLDGVGTLLDHEKATAPSTQHRRDLVGDSDDGVRLLKVHVVVGLGHGLHERHE